MKSNGAIDSAGLKSCSPTASWGQRLDSFQSPAPQPHLLPTLPCYYPPPGARDWVVRAAGREVSVSLRLSSQQEPQSRQRLTQGWLCRGVFSRWLVGGPPLIQAPGVSTEGAFPWGFPSTMSSVAGPWEGGDCSPPVRVSNCENGIPGNL